LGGNVRNGGGRKTEGGFHMSETMETILDKESDKVISVKKLLDAGVHFGHQTKRWNPKMKKYIYMGRKGIHIIDITKSATHIEEAYKKLKSITDSGGKLLIVGTKKHCQEIVREEALRSGSFYVNFRWLGGTLTNFKTIQKSIRRLNDIKLMEVNGTFDVLPKKEVSLLKKEAEKLERYLGGIKDMRKIPNAIFVVDPRNEQNAVKEARKLKIPVFGIIDTNADPDEVDYIIPGNDDASRSIKLILQVMADAVVESRGGQTVVAYKKEEGEDQVTLLDTIKSVDRYDEIRQNRQRKLKEQNMNNYQRRRYNDRDDSKVDIKPDAPEILSTETENKN